MPAECASLRKRTHSMSGLVFADPFRRLLWSPAALRRSGLPASDWLENPSSHIIRLDVPGFGREEIKVQLEEGNVLNVKGVPSSSASAEGKDALWHLSERAEKEEFSRRFALPDGIKGDMIRAQVENGVVTILAPKEVVQAKLKPRAIPISSKL